MARFAYNNIENISTDYTLFEFNCGYYSRILYKKEVDSRSDSKSADKLWVKLGELIIVCQKNLYHAQKLQKQGHNKGNKPKSYTFDEKVWLNSKYIKTKQNRKLEAKFFRPFQVLHSVGK